MPDVFDSARFLQAQENVMPAVLAELQAGRKRTHWMWFVFPQLAALGRSPTALFYGLEIRDHARAYLAHAVLGPRLVACTQLVNAVEGKSAHAVFLSPDDLKFHSCMTLFSLAGPDQPAFRTALEKYFDGAQDNATLTLLKQT